MNTIPRQNPHAVKTILNPTLALSLCLLARVAAPADSAKILDPAYKHASPEAYEQWRDPKCFAFTTNHHDGFSLWDTKTRV